MFFHRINFPQKYEKQKYDIKCITLSKNSLALYMSYFFLITLQFNLKSHEDKILLLFHNIVFFIL